MEVIKVAWMLMYNIVESNVVEVKENEKRKREIWF